MNLKESSVPRNEQGAAYAQPMAFEEMMTVAGGIHDEPVGGCGEVMRAEKRRKKSRTSSQYDCELVLLLNLLGLPLHGSPLPM